MVYWTIINTTSRKGDRLPQGVLAHRFPHTTLLPYPSGERADGLIVCGGDGTLRQALNLPLPKDLYYLPCGTVNDKGHHPQGALVVGETQLGRFGYVFATGTLCDIGYNTPRLAKRRWGRLAYLARAISAFRIHHIQASVQTVQDGREGEYTLIMLLIGKRCFGFDFVKTKDPHSSFLLTVETPQAKGFAGLVVLFCRLFRIFFLHVPPGYDRHGIRLLSTEQASIGLTHPEHWCVDGDKLTTDHVDFVRTPLDVNLHILPRRFIPKIPRRKARE